MGLDFMKFIKHICLRAPWDTQLGYWPHGPHGTRDWDMGPKGPLWPWPYNKNNDWGENKNDFG